jgi:hypothetical protein
MGELLQVGQQVEIGRAAQDQEFRGHRGGDLWVGWFVEWTGCCLRRIVFRPSLMQCGECLLPHSGFGLV